MKDPNVWSLRSLLTHCQSGPRVNIGALWLPARPLGFASIQSRLHATWLVFTGRADAVTWPEDDK